MRVVGSRTTALLPLGAVAGLLAAGLGRPGPDGQLDTVALFEQTRAGDDLPGRHRAHPLHGRVVRAAMPRLHARAILLAQADRLEAAGPDPGPAALRIALWRLDAGGSLDPAILIRGAYLARYAHDFRVVRRLIEAIPGERLDAVGALLLGEAL